MAERPEDKSPESRTSQLFQNNVIKLTEELSKDGRIVISLIGINRRVRISEAEAFEKNRVGFRYRAMNDMKPGDFWNPPMRQICQSLIVSQDETGVGACVRLLKVEYFDPTNNSYVPELRIEDQEFKQREGDIAKYLGLGKYERSQLKFLDDSDTLYVTKESQQIASISPEQANREMERL
ncbi:hypothetical protein HYU92_02785 [Candidatus Curtissbacteria bacterium]|nr:hypothetical protein [Candidatus Curtissbacteria bacterium]